MWAPITLEELNAMILTDEAGMSQRETNLWNLIRITPIKWIEESFGEEGGGFWAVGILGQQVIWYNDIEDGFNVSNYSCFGRIDEYNCNQDELYITIRGLIRFIENGELPMHRSGPSEVAH